MEIVSLGNPFSSIPQSVPLYTPFIGQSTMCSIEEKEKVMKNNRMWLLSAALLVLVSASAYAQKDPMVGGAAMYPTKNIVENAVNSKDHTTLVAAVKAGGLVDTLEGRRPIHRLRSNQ